MENEDKAQPVTLEPCQKWEIANAVSERVMENMKMAGIKALIALLMIGVIFKAGVVWAWGESE